MHAALSHQWLLVVKGTAAIVKGTAGPAYNSQLLHCCFELNAVSQRARLNFLHASAAVANSAQQGWSRACSSCWRTATVSRLDLCHTNAKLADCCILTVIHKRLPILFHCQSLLCMQHAQCQANNRNWDSSLRTSFGDYLSSFSPTVDFTSPREAVITLRHFLRFLRLQVATAAYKILLALLGDTRQSQALTGSLTSLPTGELAACCTSSAVCSLCPGNNRAWVVSTISNGQLSAMHPFTVLAYSVQYHGQAW